MKYPSMNQGREYRVSVPALDGGVNLSKPSDEIEDNQVADALNVWYKNGFLQTRPSLEAKGSHSFSVPSSSDTVRFHHFSNGNNVITSTNNFTLYCSEYASDGITPRGEHPFVFSSEAHSCFAVETKDPESEYFLFTSDKRIVRFIEVELTGKVEPYIPLVLVNGTAQNTSSGSPLSETGTVFEQHNKLTNKFRAQFTTAGFEYANFVLPQKDIKGNIEINFSLENDTGTDLQDYRWAIPSGQDSSSESNTFSYQVNGESITKNIWARVNRTAGIVWFFYQEKTWDPSVTPEPVTKSISYGLPASHQNNLEIIVENGDVPDTIYKMQFCAWFGGDRSGLAGGTRLFVSGNPDEPNLVYFSDVNNPLYFPEDNYAYVGDNTTAVTAFGKQSNMLVIFKEKELYYATYVRDEYTAEENALGVMEVNGTGAYFPLTPISATVGCDCPRTIALCNNMLVWLNSKGEVWSLRTSSQWSERNVRKLSGNIEKRLKMYSADALKNAFAADTQERYVLVVDGLNSGNDLYVLDYNSYWFSVTSSYNADSDNGGKLAWWIWNRTVDSTKIVDISGDTILVKNEDLKLYGLSQWSKSSGGDIPWEFQTKTFDFSYPERLKNISKMYIGLSGAEDSDETADDTDDLEIHCTVGTATGGTAEYTIIKQATADKDGNVLRISPNLNRIRTASFRIRSKRDFVRFSGLTLFYRFLGRTR